MPLARSTRRRLVVAVTTVITVTPGVGVLSAPASPAHAAVATDTAASAPVLMPFLKGAKLVDAGLTGFVTLADGSLDKRFTRYADGTGRGYGYRTYLRSTRTVDYLVSVGRWGVYQRNLKTLSSFDVFVGDLAGEPRYAGSAAHAVFTTVETDGTLKLRQHTEDNGVQTVTGLPAGAQDIEITPGTPEDALLTFTDGGRKKWALVDLATGSVHEVHDRTPGSTGGDIAVSETHVVWTEGDGTATPSVYVLDRASDVIAKLPVAQVHASDLQVGLVGGWVVYGEAGGLSSGDENPLYAVTAYNPATGASVKLLDHLTSSAAAPDGLYVRGGTVTDGEGLFKITAGDGGAPVVTQVANAGAPTKVEITGNTVPAVVDLDENGGSPSLRWDFSRTTVDVRITLRHIRTGKTHVAAERHPHIPSVTLNWSGTVGDGFEAAPNGAYTWQVVAEPLNGIGPATTADGTFTVTREGQPHDFNDNGTPDILTRDSAGKLWRHDTYFAMGVNASGQLVEGEAKTLVGGGWNVYDRIEATGDLGGSPVGDLVARDTSGVLWLYQGDGRGGFAGRIKVGGGWQIYDKIAGGSDLTGDGRNDLLATDRSGVLWLYSGSGTPTAPFSARKKVGGGWGVYNDLTAVGNIGGAAAGDLIARDKDGALWLYLGKGDGTFASRTRIGGGWNAYTHLVAVGDADRDGRNDLAAFGPQGNYLYRGTSSWKAPFLGRQLMGLDRPGNAQQPIV
ncbi:VCBS repeat-containing protein [Streptomyces sp. NPDC052020]|uniref:FG-GAP repeat domain-containing protein n=1 Tax=Streptomyces sp. NPDC052020 TaxID=3155677 RepID=UPI00344273DC